MNSATVQKRVLDTATGKFLFRVTPAGREFLLQEGTDQRYGARHLKRAIERYIVYPLANLLATHQVNVGDLVRIDWDGVHKELTFVRESQGALLQVEPVLEVTLAATASDEGLGKDAPSEAEAEPPKAMPALPARRPGNGASTGAESQKKRALTKSTKPVRKFRGAPSGSAPFCHGESDRFCISALNLHTDETASHAVRQFPGQQHL